MHIKEEKIPKTETHRLPHGSTTRWQGTIPNPEDVYRNFDENSIDVKEKTSFEQSETLIFHKFAGGGIGDAIMGLRYVKLVAERKPDKKCIIFVHPAILGLKHLNLPDNCQLVVSNAAAVFDNYPKWFEVKLPIPFSKIKNSSSPEEKGENVYDYACIETLHKYGISLSLDDLKESLLTFTEQEMHDFPVTFDYLFAPDAKERMVANGERSMKSPSLGQCESFFRAVPIGSTVGILMGTAHVPYCESIFAVAEKVSMERGFTLRKVETKNLDDFSTTVLQTRVFIGMDSGTTHCAYEAALAAKKMGRTVKIKEIFNSALFQPYLYALRGNNDFVDVLQGPFFKKPVTAYSQYDLSSIPITDLTEFLFGKQHKFSLILKIFKRS